MRRRPLIPRVRFQSGAPRPRQHPAREAELQGLHHDRWRSLLGFAHQEMKMLGHDHVAQYYERIPLPDLLEDSEKEVGGGRRTQKRLPMIATAGDEMKITATVEALETPGHPEIVNCGSSDVC